MDKLLNEKEMEDYLKCSYFVLSELRKKGLPFIKIGKSIRYYLEDIEIWLKNQKN